MGRSWLTLACLLGYLCLYTRFIPQDLIVLNLIIRGFVLKLKLCFIRSLTFQGLIFII